MNGPLKLILFACATSLASVVYADPIRAAPLECPTHSCPGCPPGSYITLTTIGTSCPSCACAPYSSTTTQQCMTFSCGGCPTSQRPTLTSTASTACPTCTCVPITTTFTAVPTTTTSAPPVTTPFYPPGCPIFSCASCPTGLTQAITSVSGTRCPFCTCYDSTTITKAGVVGEAMATPAITAPPTY